MARLWQTAILTNWKELFQYMPIESIIKKHQDEYYTVINNCNHSGNSNEFIEFMLKTISEAIDNMIFLQETTQEKILKLIWKILKVT